MSWQGKAGGTCRSGRGLSWQRNAGGSRGAHRRQRRDERRAWLGRRVERESMWRRQLRGGQKHKQRHATREGQRQARDAADGCVCASCHHHGFGPLMPFGSTSANERLNPKRLAPNSSIEKSRFRGAACGFHSIARSGIKDPFPISCFRAPAFAGVFFRMIVSKILPAHSLKQFNQLAPCDGDAPPGASAWASGSAAAKAGNARAAASAAAMRGKGAKSSPNRRAL